MDLEKNIQIYLKQALQSEKPLLLGFSGGEDSLALAQCFLALGVSFHIAHFDHAWRETSAQEALQLQSWASNRGIPFHTSRSPKRGQSELAAREERYAFFQSLFQQQTYQALVLAHQREDQVETILKRVLEGAHLSMLKGMKPLRQIEQMPVWRPLLGTTKEAIRTYLKENRLQPIDDPTNRDPKYLRARMRTHLVPLLQENFGKGISDSILRLGHYSAELEDYLEQRTQGHLPLEGPFGVMWDFSDSHPIEVRFILSRYFRKNDYMASQMIFERILGAIAAKEVNYRICFSSQQIVVDRGHLFLLITNPPKFSEKIPLKEGKVELGEWALEMRIDQSKERSIQNWRDWWQGKISVNIPNYDYTFEPLNPKYRKFQNTHKVPAFLRDSLPMLVNAGKPIGEFLTGNSFPQSPNNNLFFTIQIRKS